MTSETRTLIKPSDVIGIELKCPDCKSKVLFPLDNGNKLGVYCAICGKPWFDETIDPRTGQSTYPPIDSLRAIAAHLRALCTPRKDIRAQVLLQIDTTANTDDEN
jgi:hypothetical protein